MFRYIIFDIDGTMINTEHAVTHAYQSVIFQKHGRYFTEEELLKGYGVPTRSSLEKYGFTDIEKAMKDYYRYLIDGFKRCSAFDGVLDLIDTLRELKLPMGIVTSRSQYEIDQDPCLQSFINKFDKMVSADETTLHKPNPEPLLKAMEKMKANPNETIYIGDTIFDRKCARNAGIKFALALWGTNNAENIDADYLLKKPEDLLHITKP